MQHFTEFCASIRDHLRHSKITIFNGPRLAEPAAQVQCYNLLFPLIKETMLQHGYKVEWTPFAVKVMDSHVPRFRNYHYQQKINLSSDGFFDFVAIDCKTQQKISFLLQVKNSYVEHIVSLSLKQDDAIPSVYQELGPLDVMLKIATNKNKFMNFVREATAAQLSSAGSGRRPKPPNSGPFMNVVP